MQTSELRRFARWPARRCTAASVAIRTSRNGTRARTSIQFAYESSRHCISIGQLAMRYERVIVTRYDGPEVISLIEEDLPAPQPEEVRVNVLAAGVSLPVYPRFPVADLQRHPYKLWRR
jgi:hypothetical protein